MFKLTIATPERHFGVFSVNFEHISHTPFSIVDTEQVNFSSVNIYWSLYSL